MKNIYLYSAFALILILITVNFIAGTTIMAFITQLALAGFAAFAAAEIAKGRNKSAEEEFGKIHRDISSLKNLIEKSIAKTANNIEHVKSELKNFENFAEEKSRLTERKLTEKIDNLKQAEKEYRIKFDDDLETLNRIVTQSRENVNSIKSETGEKHRQIESTVSELRFSLGNGISSKIVTIENTIQGLVENINKQDESIIDNLAKDFSKLKSNSEDFKKKINEIEFKLNRKSDISKLNSEITSLKSSIDEVNTSLNILKDENKWGVESFNQLKNDIFSFRESIKASLFDGNQYINKEDLFFLERQLNELSEKAGIVHNRIIPQIEIEINEIKQINEYLSNNINSHKKKFIEIPSLIENLTKRFEQTKTFVDSTYSTLNEKIINLSSSNYILAETNTTKKLNNVEENQQLPVKETNSQSFLEQDNFKDKETFTPETEEEIINKIYNMPLPEKSIYNFTEEDWIINPKHGFELQISEDKLFLDCNIPDDKKKYIFNGGKGKLTEPPLEKLKYQIEANTFYFINVKCKVDQEIALWVIFYDENTRIDKYNYQIKPGNENHPNYFKTPDDVKYFRFALRYENQIHSELDNILFTQLANVGIEPRQALFEDFIPEKIFIRHNGLKIACILDTFSFNCFKYEADLLPITKDDWKEVFINEKPNLFLCESAWHGNDGEWDKMISQYEIDGPLAEILEYCKQNSIPTVFWNKEDPPNYDVFIGAAKNFDYIFTTDKNCVPKYIEDSGHENCYDLPFAAQPQIHNPMKRVNKKDANVCFAGSWYGNKHEERLIDMKTVLDPSMEFGLNIFDRNFYRNANSMRFPINYLEFVKGSLEYDKMLTAYRAYKIFLNVNSVKDSPTMFSRRVFELLACGTNVISTESIGISKIFSNLVLITKSKAETRKYLQNLLSNEEEREKFAHLGYRYVMEKHTYSSRMNKIFEKTGLSRFSKNYQKPLISVISVLTNSKYFGRVLENFDKQSYPKTELLLLIKGVDFDIRTMRNQISNRKNVRVSKVELGMSIKDCIKFGLSNCIGEYFSLMHENAFYGKHYLSDMIFPFGFSSAGIIGKDSFAQVDKTGRIIFKKGNQHSYCEYVKSWSIVGKTAVAEYLDITQTSDEKISVILKPENEFGYKTYSADKYNFIDTELAGRYLEISEIERFLPMVFI